MNLKIGEIQLNLSRSRECDDDSIIQRFGTQLKFHIFVISKIGLLRRQKKKSFDLITIVSRVHTQDDPEKSTKFENVTGERESARGQRKLFNSFIIR